MSDSIPLVDLAAERVGGKALLASDEFFAPKENLLRLGRGVFVEEKYTDHGKWMDGWESRRRRGPGHDWCIIRLGLPGTIKAVTVDTNHFSGNHPEACSLDMCEADAGTTGEALAARDDWSKILPTSPLEGHSENHFLVATDRRATHVRLHIYPDGGVARLRIRGEVMPDWASILAGGEAIDLLAIEHGGVPLACSDQFFSEPINLIMPGRSTSMKDGWETRRRRGPGHDWAILHLGRPGVLERLVIDTNHFKGNFPESCSVEGCDAPGATAETLQSDAVTWRELLPRTKLTAHHEHVFERLEDVGALSHVRINSYPDGGISRFRAFGRPVPAVG